MQVDTSESFSMFFFSLKAAIKRLSQKDFVVILK